MPVFYNPKMRVNRDLAVLGLEYTYRKMGRKLKVADPLSASGIRALRFLLETDAVDEVLANDINPTAVKIMEENFKLNQIPRERYRIICEDANFFLRKSWGFGFDYVDLDPFGTPVPFIESVALSMKRGGLLSLTATDTAPLSGTYPKTCRRRYGSLPLRNEFKHEVGIRILIKKVIELSAQHDIAMKPIFAYSHLHYFKLFFVKDRGAKATDSLIDQIGYILFCFSCSYRKPVKELVGQDPYCPHCKTELKVGGPLWIGPLWEEEFVRFLKEEASKREELAKATKRILTLIEEEAKLGSVVGFYMASKLCERLRIPKQPPIRKVVELFEGVRTHFEGDGFRTPLDHGEVLNRAQILKEAVEERLK